ncbi:hypothetical protein [Flavicella sediminum]|uniref:hypothetical protein n=1 Tax=Flavicella sediminum TaxID=2585141 RepID=UPI00112419FF|nr:hypothetical protein [Flavicella sediminum]
MKKISVGLLAGAIIGILISSYFVNEFTFDKVIYTKITLSSIITGIICGTYAIFSKKEFNLFLGCLIIGASVFYIKFLITGHDFDPINMGTLTGAILGFIFYAIHKFTHKDRSIYKD